MSRTWGEKRKKYNPANHHKKQWESMELPKEGTQPWHSLPGHFCSASDSVQTQGRVPVWNPSALRCSQVCANDEMEKTERKTEEKRRKIFPLQLSSAPTSHQQGHQMFGGKAGLSRKEVPSVGVALVPPPLGEGL